MDLMARRFAMMAQVGSGEIDTSPRIAEYGVCWNRTYGSTTQNANWCITERYNNIDAPYGYVSIQGNIGNDSNQITFQYEFSDGSNDWYYFGGVNPRPLPSTSDKKLSSITFSIEQSVIDSSYAYIVQTGAIIFAGRNTPYYGYTNINDMPTGT